MNIGIVTIVDNDNFGNRLQNYAVQEFLKGQGYNVVTFKNKSYSNTKDKYLLRKIKHLFEADNYSKNINRRNAFQIFNNNILFSEKQITALTKHNDCDYYIVGSDQVWNPYIGRMREVDLLSFVKPEKRISLSASIGVDMIPDECKRYFCEQLLKFNRISVREDKAKRIVEDLTGRNDVEVLIDPTMSLSKDEWHNVSKKPHFDIPEKYILLYFLGDITDNYYNEIKRVAKENNCEIININDKNSKYYEIGPSEFLYLEENAFLICTDSFHSSVFGFLFDIPFIVFDRVQNNCQNMNSRIQTLLNKFKLQNRMFEEKITANNICHDYTNSYQILNEERVKYKEFLKNSLSNI